MMKKHPFFSIIIPTYDRPNQLASCLESLTRLNYPHDRFEVIVVDDGGKISSEAVVNAFSNQLDINLFIQTNAGPASARNAGVRLAKGELLAFIDDDCMPAENWLQSLGFRFAQEPDHAIGGRTVNALPDNLYSTASQLLSDYVYSYNNTDHRQTIFFTSNNLSVPADRMRRIGGFDTIFHLAGAEDRDLCERWLQNGFKMTYAPEVVVYHRHALTFRTFLLQHSNYGRGAFYLHYLHVRRGYRKFRIEPPSFYINLLRYPFSHAKGLKAFFLVALLAASQMANAIGFLWERLQRTNAPNLRIL